MKVAELDKTDRRLLRELQANSSLSVAELAEMQQQTAAEVDTTLNRICV